MAVSASSVLAEVDCELSDFIQLLSKSPLELTEIIRIPSVGKSDNWPNKGLILLNTSSANVTPIPKVKLWTGLPEKAAESTIVNDSSANSIVEIWLLWKAFAIISVIFGPNESSVKLLFANALVAIFRTEFGNSILLMAFPAKASVFIFWTFAPKTTSVSDFL